jgi:hypothetical protein
MPTIHWHVCQDRTVTEKGVFLMEPLLAALQHLRIDLGHLYEDLERVEGNLTGCDEGYTLAYVAALVVSSLGRLLGGGLT